MSESAKHIREQFYWWLEAARQDLPELNQWMDRYRDAVVREARSAEVYVLLFGRNPERVSVDAERLRRYAESETADASDFLWAPYEHSTQLEQLSYRSEVSGAWRLTSFILGKVQVIGDVFEKSPST